MENEISPANLKTLPINENRRSIYDMFKPYRNHEDFINFVASTSSLAREIFMEFPNMW